MFYWLRQQTDRQIVATHQKMFEVVKYCENDELQDCYLWWSHTHTHTHIHTHTRARENRENES